MDDRQLSSIRMTRDTFHPRNQIFVHTSRDGRLVHPIKRLTSILR